MLTDWQTISWLIPEAVLVGGATLLSVGGAFKRSGRGWLVVALLMYFGAAAALLALEGPRWRDSVEPLFSGAIVVDVLGHIMRLLALAAGALITLMLGRHPQQRLHTELLGLMMFATVGAMLTARANELVLMFVGLELVSIPLYALLYVGGKGRAGGESAAKYFYLSVLSSALLLYGLSFVYGSAGTTWLVAEPGIDSIRSSLGTDGGPFALLGLALVVAGLGFKIAAAPFHFYAPDVFQGTSNANAAILSVAPKLAGFAAIVRIVIIALGSFNEFSWQLALVLAVLTMTIGNVCALWQTNIRRMMAYSSIAHAGYMLIGIAVASVVIDGQHLLGGAAAMLYYLCVYTLGTACFFAVLSHLSSEERSIDAVDDLAGLGARRPLLAGLVAVAMFSLSGLPPLAGFWGKLTLFSSAIRIGLGDYTTNVSFWFLLLAVLGALNAAVAAAYYLRVIAAMYFRPAAGPALATGLQHSSSSIAAIVAGLLLIVLGIYQAPLAEWSGRAERSLRSGIELAESTEDRAPAVAATVARESTR